MYLARMRLLGVSLCCSLLSGAEAAPSNGCADAAAASTLGLVAGSTTLLVINTDGTVFGHAVEADSTSDSVKYQFAETVTGDMAVGVLPDVSIDFEHEMWEPLQLYVKVTVPSEYDPSTPLPLLIGAHGWGGNENALNMYHLNAEDVDGVTPPHVVATPRGWNDFAMDPAAEHAFGSPNSWNCELTGTTNYNGSAWGETCCMLPGCGSGINQYCALYYAETCKCGVTVNVENQCSWTTCLDSTGAIVRMLTTLEDLICIDTSRVLTTGYSNGGVFQFELAAQSRTRDMIDIFTVTAGAPHAGFNVPPAKKGATLFGMYGIYDTTIPPLANPDAFGHPGDPTASLDTFFDGWFYSTSRNNSLLWASENGCDIDNPIGYTYLKEDFSWEPSKMLIESLTDQHEFAQNIADPSFIICTEWPGCTALNSLGEPARVVECLHDATLGNAIAGHVIPSWAPELITREFFSGGSDVTPVTPSVGPEQIDAVAEYLYIMEGRSSDADSKNLTLILAATLTPICVLLLLLCVAVATLSFFEGTRARLSQTLSFKRMEPEPEPVAPAPEPAPEQGACAVM